MDAQLAAEGVADVEAAVEIEAALEAVCGQTPEKVAQWLETNLAEASAGAAAATAGAGTPKPNKSSRSRRSSGAGAAAGAAAAAAARRGALRAPRLGRAAGGRLVRGGQ